MSYMYGLLSTIGWLWTGIVFVALVWRWQKKQNEAKARGLQIEIEPQNKG